ncbi:MAG: S41 family peptidase [Bacteroidota bacterium]
MKKYFLISLLFVGLFSCNEDEEPRIAAEAEEFLNEVLNIMEANSINRNTIDWTEFRSKVFERVGAAQTIDEVYPGIGEALTLLGDNHSFFLKPDGGSIWGRGTIRCDADLIFSFTVPENIGYVKVSGFSGSSQEGVAFADRIQDQIRSQDSPDIIGWVVDLRGNTGGNMWPMLAGIGPVLGEGASGHFVDPDDSRQAWGYNNGRSIIQGNTVVQSSNPYELINPNPKVAVLLDNDIASSGEAIAIAFVGRENTRSFGSPTCGLSTANSGFTLSNDSQLILTVSYMADRNLKLYGTPIVPDVEASNEEVFDRAVFWLSE